MENTNNTIFSSAEVETFTIIGIVVVIIFVIIAYAGQILETMCLIMLIFNFIKRKNSFCTGFYYILAIGYVVTTLTAAISTVSIILDITEKTTEIMLVIQELIEQYLALLLGTVIPKNKKFVLKNSFYL